jgi:Protein of unknown function (DUF4054)
MPSTAADIFATFPEFAGADPDAVTSALELAEADQADLWGDVRYQYAIAYRAANDMVGLGLGASGTAGTGAVTSKRIGSLAVSYADPGGTGAFGNTRYGQLLEALIAGAVVLAVVDCGTPACGCDGGHAQAPPWGSAPFAWRSWWPR